MSLSVSLHECRVAVDVFAKTFADDQIGLRHFDVLGDLCAFGVLHAMVGPQYLVTIANLDHLERLLVWIAGRERHVVVRMPVLRHHHVVESLGDAVEYPDRRLLTAKLPPGRKQFCTSTTISALAALGLILSAANAKRARPSNA
jgi:hypothetical protein